MNIKNGKLTRGLVYTLRSFRVTITMKKAWPMMLLCARILNRALIIVCKSIGMPYWNNFLTFTLPCITLNYIGIIIVALIWPPLLACIDFDSHITLLVIICFAELYASIKLSWVGEHNYVFRIRVEPGNILFSQQGK